MKRTVFAVLAVFMMCVSSAYAADKELSLRAQFFMGALAWLNDDALLDMLPKAADTVEAVGFCQSATAKDGFIDFNGTAVDMGPLYRHISAKSFCMNLSNMGNMMDANDLRRYILLAWSNAKTPKDPDLIYAYEARWLSQLVDLNIPTPHQRGFIFHTLFLGIHKANIDGLETVRSPDLDKFITEIAVGKLNDALKTLRAAVSNEEVNKASAAMNVLKTNTMSGIVQIEGKRLTFVARKAGNIDREYPEGFKLLPPTIQDVKPAAKRKAN